MCIVNRHTHRNRRTQLREWESYGYEAPRRGGFRTSTTELLHLAVALIVLTTAFTFFFANITLDFERGFVQRTGEEVSWGLLEGLSVPDIAVLSFMALGTGFILHELMHKVVAQIYGHWAEFRAQTIGLIIPIPLALFTPFIFAAPGAVVIAGYVQRHQNGIISAAGPLTNILIGFIALPFTFIPGSSGTFGHSLALIVAAVNSFLALFNMLPIFVLDGRKVWRWNKFVFLGIWAIGLLLFIMVLPSL